MVDHANRYLLLGQPWMEQAGRFVFPIFALVLGHGLRGCDGEARARRVLLPLLGLALVAELAALPLMLQGVRAWQGNVLWTLAGGCALIGVSECGSRAWRVAVWVVVLAASCAAEYGPVGVLLVYAGWSMRAWLVGACLALLSVAQLTLVPLLALPLVSGVMRWCGEERVGSVRRMFGWLYVGQFVVFSAVVALGA